MNGPKPGWRDWIAAVWAEAHEVPPGLPRLAWRAGSGCSPGKSRGPAG